MLFQAAPKKPLPVTAALARGELLSSWVERTAAIYAVFPRRLLVHAGIQADRPRDIDFAPSPSLVDRLAWLFRVDRPLINRMCHPRQQALIGREISIDLRINCCSFCESRDRSQTIRRRSWYEIWRITCDGCGRPFIKDGDISKLLWRDALKGSALVDRWYRRLPCGLLPPGIVFEILTAYVRPPGRSRSITALQFIASDAADRSENWPPSVTLNPGGRRRIGMLAGLARFAACPGIWIAKLLELATISGKSLINGILGQLPEAIVAALQGDDGNQHPTSSALLVEADRLSRKLTANRRQIDECCRELTLYAAQQTAESHN